MLVKKATQQVSQEDYNALKSCDVSGQDSCVVCDVSGQDSCAVFAFLLRLPFSQFTHPLFRYPCIYEKNFKIFAVKKVGGRGVCNNPPVLRGKGWQPKYIKFPNFHFLIFSFCHNSDYAPDILET